MTLKKALDRQLFRRRMWSKVVESGKKSETLGSIKG